MNTSKTVDSLITALSNPQRFLPGLVEFGFGWAVTRRLASLVWLAPLLVGLGFMFAFSLWGSFRQENQMATQYLKQFEIETGGSLAKIESQVEDPEKTVGELFAETEISEDSELLLRRLLQLNRSANRATLIVAIYLAEQNRIGQARALLRRISPENASGYPPGHAWLANDELGQGEKVRDARATRILLNDLENAIKWSGAGWYLIGAYADELEKQGRVTQAISLLEDSAERSPKLAVKLAAIANRNSKPGQLERGTSQAKQRIENMVSDGVAEEDDHFELASMHLLSSEPDEAIMVAQRGLQDYSDSTALKRVLSEAYRVKYITSMRPSEDGESEVQLGFLDAALKADPTNPGVAQEVARLLATGQRATPELRTALEQLLAKGEATAITHRLLAAQCIQTGDLRTAVTHLEIANREAPNSPDIMNNLALGIARTDRNQLARANELIDQAVALSFGQDATFLDTQGEIKMIGEDYLGAIKCFETAIGLDSSRIDTRTRLAMAYRAVGMKELAMMQEKEVVKLRSATPQ